MNDMPMTSDAPEQQQPTTAPAPTPPATPTPPAPQPEIKTPPSPAKSADILALEHRLNQHRQALWALFVLWLLTLAGLLWLWHDGSAIRQEAAAQAQALNARIDDAQQRADDYADSKDQALSSRLDDLTQMMRSMQVTIDSMKTNQDGQTPVGGAPTPPGIVK